MLVISGTAESVSAQSKFNKGNKHAFSLFTENENLEEQLDTIESYLNNKGWDNIIIEEQELVSTNTDINHSVLVEALKRAEQDGISGVVCAAPLN